MYAFFGDVVIMHMVAVGMSLTCEAPFMRLFKMGVADVRGTTNSGKSSAIRSTDIWNNFHLMCVSGRDVT